MDNGETKNETKYVYATGRRKTAVAKVRLYDSSAKEKSVMINGKDCREYFSKNNILIDKIFAPFKLLNLENKFGMSIKVNGGGSNSQAEAIRLGISRILLGMNNDYKTILKSQNYLTRDPREVERKKPGLKKARRAPQWQKR